AITTPYLPEELPLKSVLHIAFAFLAAVLLILFLLLVSWAQYQQFPDRYRSFLMGILMIIAGSAVLFISVGIISTVLEIYVTFTTVFMADRLLEAAASERAYLLQME
ncbi:MAG: hypothetical protein ACLTKI_04280, partial [Lachnospiraceae bacterium]